MNDERDVLGTSAIPVYVVSDAELAENGGEFTVEGGSAIPIYIVVES